jgi:hypothetical protein
MPPNTVGSRKPGAGYHYSDHAGCIPCLSKHLLRLTFNTPLIISAGKLGSEKGRIHPAVINLLEDYAPGIQNLILHRRC